jgi:hypothetical protein
LRNKATKCLSFQQNVRSDALQKRGKRRVSEGAAGIANEMGEALSYTVADLPHQDFGRVAQIVDLRKRMDDGSDRR